MNISRHWVIATLLGFCVFCESMAYTYVQEEGKTFFYSSSLLYFFSGIAICILPLLNTKPRLSLKPAQHWLYRFWPYIFYTFLVSLLVYHIVLLSPLYKNFHIDAQWADMIPVIQLSCNRLLHGTPVYALTNEIRPGSINAYFPMMWLPYLPSVIFGFDARWTTVSALFIALFAAALPLLKRGSKTEFVPMCIAGASLFLVLNFFLFKNNGFWAMTEEGVVTGYYILLGFALLSENYYLAGITIGCCLLSRYALLPWIPVYFGYLFFTQSRSSFMKAFLTCCIFVLVVFIIPWFIWNPLYFLGLPGVQASAVPSFWEGNRIAENLYYNVGLYKFFDFSHVGFMVPIELATSFLLPLIYILVAVKLQKRYALNSRYIAYGSLKMCLICFYNFIPTPYMYLFFPATLISYAVLFDYIANKPLLPETALA